MIDDVVIDANVMAHSQNPQENRFGASCKLLKGLLAAETCLAVDKGFSPDPSKDLSFIGNEYRPFLTFGSLALATVSKLATSKRIRFLSKRAPRREQRIINQIIRNKRDRVLLAVAFNSVEHVLVSHDFKDFDQNKRSTIVSRLGVSVIEAAQAHGLVI